MVSIVISVLHPGYQQAGWNPLEDCCNKTGENNVTLFVWADSNVKNFFVKEMLQFFYPTVASFASAGKGGGGSSPLAPVALAG
jgi:hypothetical protein